MESNPVLTALMQRATVRKFTEQPVSEAVIETIARAGQQAPFATPMYSVMVTTDEAKRQVLRSLFGPLGAAPVFFLICMDLHKAERLIEGREVPEGADDLNLLMWSMQDAAYVAQNMVIAAESLGLGSCFLGGAPWKCEPLAELFSLPQRVFPLVGLVMGYPAESPKPRPRMPLRFTLHWDAYREMTAEDVSEALSTMDEGLHREGYYQKYGSRIGADESEGSRYGYGAHLARKYQNLGRFDSLREKLAARGISLEPPRSQV